MRNQSFSLILFGAILVIALVWRWIYVEWTLFRTNLGITNAEEQVEVFYEKKEQAAQGGPAEKAACVSFIQGYSPSSMKGIEGTAIHRLLEKIREETIREIFGQMAGEDRSHFQGRK